jgi:hypothetical protein
MRNIIKRILPQPVAARVKAILSHPRVYYLRMAARTYRQWLFKSWPAKYQADKALLIANYTQHEGLFARSVQNFKATVSPYVSEFRWSLGRLYNGEFVSTDPELYYSMIRRYRPHLIIEIGSGHSSHFAADALKMNQSGHMICIDPEPRRTLPKGAEHIRAKVEDTSIDMCAALKENDILFIDSSHTAEEAHYQCKHILPGLARGVLIHHHDFTFPYCIYYGDDPLVFGEPSVLIDFYSANSEAFEVLTCTSYVRFRDPHLVTELIKSYRWNALRVPGSLWARRMSGQVAP